MGVTTVTHEYTVALPPATMFNAYIRDSHIVIPKAMPQAIRKMELIQGQWGAPGCVTKTTFVEGYVKHKIDVVDKHNLVFKYTVFEGYLIEHYIECVKHEVSFKPSGSGCLCKLTIEYHTKSGFEVSMDLIHATKEKTVHHHTIVNNYLLANPNYT